MSMKKVIIIHGWEGTPESDWLPWLKQELSMKNFEVIVPAMPNTDEPEINAWINKLKEVSGEVNEDTYFVGHSIGCQTVIRYLETLSENIKVGRVILVAPYITLTEFTYEEWEDDAEKAREIARPWMETPIAWEKVKSHTNKFIAIFSDNDAYVDIQQNRPIFEDKLGAKIIIEHNKSHFDGASNIKELPIVRDELLEK